MPDKHPTWEEIERDRDEPVKLPLDPEEALRGLIGVDPHDDAQKADKNRQDLQDRS